MIGFVSRFLFETSALSRHYATHNGLLHAFLKDQALHTNISRRPVFILEAIASRLEAIPITVSH